MQFRNAIKVLTKEVSLELFLLPISMTPLAQNQPSTAQAPWHQLLGPSPKRALVSWLSGTKVPEYTSGNSSGFSTEHYERSTLDDPQILVVVTIERDTVFSWQLGRSFQQHHTICMNVVQQSQKGVLPVEFTVTVLGSSE